MIRQTQSDYQTICLSNHVLRHFGVERSQSSNEQIGDPEMLHQQATNSITGFVTILY